MNRHLVDIGNAVGTSGLAKRAGHCPGSALAHLAIFLLFLLTITACTQGSPVVTPGSTATPVPTDARTPLPTESGLATPTQAATATATSVPVVTPVPAATPTLAATPTRLTTPIPTVMASLPDILSRGANTSMLKVAMTVSSPGTPPVSQQMQVKMSKVRIDFSAQGQPGIDLIDTQAQSVYVYYPSQNMAMKMNYYVPPSDGSWAPPGQLANTIQDSGPALIGTDSRDGKDCAVVRYATDTGSAKAWIWLDRGLPIRTETATGSGTVVIEYRDFDFSDIADSVFELPAGVRIVTVPKPPQ